MPYFRKAASPVVPRIGAIYRHYKGDHYMVVGFTRDSESTEVRVSYQQPGNDFPWSRVLVGTDPDGKPCGWSDIAVEDDEVLRRYTQTDFKTFEEVFHGRN